MISLIDSHAHIDLPVYDDDREAMLGRALAAGVHAIVVIGHNRERWRTSAALCARVPWLVRSVGLHPNDAADWSDALRRDLEAQLEAGGPVAIGETGLDFYRDSAPEDLQRRAFAAQIEFAQRYELPIIIRQRSAEQPVLEMLREHGPVRGVMHCFSGDSSFARECVEAGLMLGVGGIATYPKSQDVRDALATVPIESLVLETDAPYLAPHGWRGKRNEPGHVVVAAEVLAAVHGMTLDAVAKATTVNAIGLFGASLEAARLAGMAAAK
ncbi:MAG TPA: TatD family hydrolase [Thermomicrobiales bacterium]|nr:TatD family hydrolase [Thermomicrobiales bacterium]